MTVEAAGFMEQMRRSDGVAHHVEGAIKKKRFRKRVRIQLRRPENLEAVSGTLQRLFDACNRIFKGPGTVPSDSDVRDMCRIIGKRF